MRGSVAYQWVDRERAFVAQRYDRNCRIDRFLRLVVLFPATAAIEPLVVSVPVQAGVVKSAGYRP
jgi:hypothetical protein